jgi:hypothetical protein
VPRRTYRITVHGRVSERLASAFSELTTAEQRPGQTSLTGTFVDASQLYGVLEHMRDLGLELARVEEVAT